MVKASKKMDRSCSLPYKTLEDEPRKGLFGNQRKWVVLTALLATYGFLKNISPEFPYLAGFFSGPRFNFTMEQVTQDIYTVGVYSCGVQTLIILLVTDILRYKPVIVIGACGIIMNKSLLVWGRTLLEIQGTQFFWGMSKACSLAYKTYIYSKVDRVHYQRVTAIIRIAPKAGTLFSSVLSQMVVSVFLMNIDHLNRISLVSSVMALGCAIMLPSLKHSIYFNKDKNANPNTAVEKKSSYGESVRLLFQDFKDAYTNPYIIKWCIWWILATGGFQQATDFYVQTLWSEISQVNQNKYNAGVEAVCTIVSGVSCYMIGILTVNWRSGGGELMLGLCTLVKGLSLLYNAHTRSILVSYIIYVAFCTLYDLMMVISNSEVAKHLKNESFALIFGTNTFLALVFQSLLTFLLTSKYVFALQIRQQFIYVGYGFVVLGLAYCLKAIYSILFGSKPVEVKSINDVASPVPPLKVPDKSGSKPHISIISHNTV